MNTFIQLDKMEAELFWILLAFMVCVCVQLLGILHAVGS